MRSVILGIAVVLALLLHGCGRKGPLKLQAPEIQQSGPQTSDAPRPVEPPARQGKEP